MSALDEYLKNEKELELVSCIEVVVSEEVAKDRVLGRNREMMIRLKYLTTE